MNRKVTDTAEVVTNRLALVRDAKANLAFQSERLGRAVASKLEIVEESKAALGAVKEQGIEQETSTLEQYERWEMRTEELTELLCGVTKDKLAAKEVVARTVPVLPGLQREQARWKQLEEVTGICLELLSDNVEFYERNQERTTFIVRYK